MTLSNILMKVMIKFRFVNVLFLVSHMLMIYNADGLQKLLNMFYVFARDGTLR